MSNRINYTSYEFNELKSPDNKTYGFVIYDDYEYQVAMHIEKENLEKLENIICEIHQNIPIDCSLFNDMQEKGAYIDNQWYDGNEIKKIVNNLRKENKL